MGGGLVQMPSCNPSHQASMRAGTTVHRQLPAAGIGAHKDRDHCLLGFIVIAEKPTANQTVVLLLIILLF